jgi:hypothetical protein
MFEGRSIARALEHPSKKTNEKIEVSHNIKLITDLGFNGNENLNNDELRVTKNGRPRKNFVRSDE